MNKKEKMRLMLKYRVKSCSNGVYGMAFLEGLSAAESYAGRKKIKESDVELPINTPSRRK